MVEPRILGDFLVVAARLVLIKSKALLPSFELTGEEETEIKDLEARLKIYKEFRQASQLLEKIWGQGRQSFARELLMNSDQAKLFYPSKNLTKDNLAIAANKLLSSLKSLLPEATVSVKRTIVTLENKIGELVERLKTAVQQSFKEISSGKNKQEIIVSFLAILHLLKDRLINVEQSGQFSDIILKKVDRGS